MRKITSFISVIALVLSTNVFANALCVQGARITSIAISDGTFGWCDNNCLRVDYTRNNELGLIKDSDLDARDGIIILNDKLGLDTFAGKMSYNLLKAALALGLQVDVRGKSNDVMDCKIFKDRAFIGVSAASVQVFSKLHRKWED